LVAALARVIFKSRHFFFSALRASVWALGRTRRPAQDEWKGGRPALREEKASDYSQDLRRFVVDQKSPSKVNSPFEAISDVTIKIFVVQFLLRFCELMASLIEVLSKWPLVRQIRERKDGTGLESMSDKTRAMHARIDDAEVARSICPYCGVGADN